MPTSCCIQWNMFEWRYSAYLYQYTYIYIWRGYIYIYMSTLIFNGVPKLAHVDSKPQINRFPNLCKSNLYWDRNYNSSIDWAMGIKPDWFSVSNQAEKYDYNPSLVQSNKIQKCISLRALRKFTKLHRFCSRLKMRFRGF